MLYVKKMMKYIIQLIIKFIDMLEFVGKKEKLYVDLIFFFFFMFNIVVLDFIFDEEEKVFGIQNFYKIVKMLFDMKLNDIQEFVIFDDFLCKLDMNLVFYLQVIWLILFVFKIFLKCIVEEVCINSYNKILLKCWEVNMDIQFIFDFYVCVLYIVLYILKG